jgi:hypothetical protein
MAAEVTGTLTGLVMRGLDPRIRQSSQKNLSKRWIAGSSPAMTNFKPSASDNG